MKLSIISLLFIIQYVIAVNDVRIKRAYTMVDYICHKQPYLSICNQRRFRASPSPSINNKLNIDPYDNDPMPTPGPLPLGELQSAYDVARRREQEEPEDVKVKEPKTVKILSKNRSPPSDIDLLSSAEEVDRQYESTTVSNNEETRVTEDTIDRSTSHSSHSTQSNEESTQQPLNPRLRYQQYEKALKEYYKVYPQQSYYNQGYYGYPQSYNSQSYHSQGQSQYQPSQNYQQAYYQPGQNQYYNQYYQPPQTYQQAYYPQQSQPNYYQPNGFNFGIGSQLQIPFAGPIGLSSGFGFSG